MTIGVAPRQACLRGFHHRAHLFHGRRTRLGDGGGVCFLNFFARSGLRQIFFDDGDLFAFFRSQLLAPGDEIATDLGDKGVYRGCRAGGLEAAGKLSTSAEVSTFPERISKQYNYARLVRGRLKLCLLALS
jgi:hypothetical protein